MSADRATRDDNVPKHGATEQITRCECDFCTGKKLHSDNWCARCAEVKMVLPKWWENLDVCDACEKKAKRETDLLREILESPEQP